MCYCEGDVVFRFSRGSLSESYRSWQFALHLHEDWQCKVLTVRPSLGEDWNPDCCVWIPCLSLMFAMQLVFSGTKVELLKLHLHCMTNPGRPVFPVHSWVSLQVAPDIFTSSCATFTSARRLSVILSSCCLSTVIFQLNKSHIVFCPEMSLRYSALSSGKNMQQNITTVRKIIAK